MMATPQDPWHDARPFHLQENHDPLKVPIDTTFLKPREGSGEVRATALLSQGFVKSFETSLGKSMTLLGGFAIPTNGLSLVFGDTITPLITAS
jgi:hypothetical protein